MDVLMIWNDQFSAEISNPHGPGKCTIHNRELIKDSRYDCDRSSHSAMCSCKDRYDCPECNSDFMTHLQRIAMRCCKECQCTVCEGEGTKYPIDWNEGIVKCPVCKGSGIKENHPHELHKV